MRTSISISVEAANRARSAAVIMKTTVGDFTAEAINSLADRNGIPKDAQDQISNIRQRRKKPSATTH